MGPTKGGDMEEIEVGLLTALGRVVDPETAAGLKSLLPCRLRSKRSSMVESPLSARLAAADRTKRDRISRTVISNSCSTNPEEDP